MNDLTIFAILWAGAWALCLYIRYDCDRQMKRVDKELAEIGIDTSKWK